jgi:hypothetical protein
MNDNLIENHIKRILLDKDMLQQNDLDTKQLITDLTNLLTRGVDRIVGNNIKKREMLERKQQYVTETLTQLLLKLGEEESGFDDISAITSKTLENDNIEEYNSNSNSSFNEDFFNNNDEAREQYLSNYVTYKEVEESLLKDDTYVYSGKYLAVHGPNTRYLHETHESAWNDENRHDATFTGIIGNDNHEMRYGKELFEKQIQSLVKDCFKEDNVNDLKYDVNNVNDDANDEKEVVKDVLQIQTVLNDVFEEEEEEMIIEEEEPKEVLLNDVKEEELNDGEEELFEIQIDGKTYATDNEINGVIYALVDDGDVGDKVGYFKDGKAFFQ